MKKLLILGMIIIVISIIYMNRSYAHIYNKIEETNLKSTDMQQIYNLGNKSEKSLLYVAMGDSLTAGVGIDNFEKSYPYQVAQNISEKGNNVTLNIQARPGAKSVDIINSFLDSTIKLQPDIVTLFVGVNDVHGNISKEEFRNNYEIILNRLTKETKAKIYVINLPYLGAKNLILPPYDYYFKNRTEEFNEIIKKLSEDYELRYIDLYTLYPKFSFENFYSEDLFHPSDIGYKLWSEIIYAGFN
jgi:lysophospholipase L1-like esterase